MSKTTTIFLLALLVVFPALAEVTELSDSRGKPADAGHDDAGHDDDEGHGDDGGGHGHSSRFSDDDIPLQLDAVPDRPKPLLELGANYLGTGTLSPGFQLPTGAVWQPQLLVFGTLRTAVQSFESDDSPSSRITEWTHRLDLFANLQLSGSERLVVGIRAFDEAGQFTSYYLEHPDPAFDGEFVDEIDANLEVLFFEGDFGEIFPNLDRDDFKSHDVGFSVGRQQLFFQEGMLINDVVDGVGFTRNTLQPKATSNFRATFFYGWDNLNISNIEQREANLYALLTSTDFPSSTVEIDVVYVDAYENSGYGDLVAAGISTTQRLGKTNSSLRLLGSYAPDGESADATEGFLLFNELSWTPAYSEDLFYVTTFLAVDEYTSAARDIGGPLGRVGINFASVGLGSYQAPLSGAARDAAGGAIGYQKFFAHGRKQLLLEAAGRVGISNEVSDSYAGTVRFQSAVGHHTVVVVDGFFGYDDATDRNPYGGRLELLFKF
jgi:hypothetical protein